MASDLGHWDNHPAYHYDGIIVGDDISLGKAAQSSGNWEMEAVKAVGWFSAHGGVLALSTSS
jgi:hypothetical protein